MAIVEKVDGFFIPNVTLIGVGAAKAIPERIVYLNATKPLLVTDKGIVHTGILKQITDILDEAAMEYAIYDETVPNPTDLNVAAGVELYKKEECDSLISIGGGSSHDCCKGIGLVVSNGGKIHDYEGVDKSTKAMPPYLAVNTTAGTASEITRFCIITDSARKVKMAIVDWRITPSVAINDPILMVGMPPALTAATGMDALTHAVEAYVSTGATPLKEFISWESTNRELESWNMLYSQMASDMNVTTNLWEGLLSFDCYGKAVPSVAKEWSHNEDSSVWTFNLRDDVDWVDVNGEVFGKPHSPDDARRMLRALSGATHYVHTGVCVSDGSRTESFVDTCKVTFFPLSEEEIERYAATEEPYDKAGAYAIQGRAAVWLDAIEGDYYTIMGLPVSRTVRLLEQF